MCLRRNKKENDFISYSQCQKYIKKKIQLAEKFFRFAEKAESFFTSNVFY
jgi:hypothetical protein